MIRKALGGLLVALPFVGLFVGGAILVGVVKLTVATLVALLISGTLYAGITLLMGED